MIEPYLAEKLSRYVCGGTPTGGLDRSGRAFAATVPLVLTTPAGAERLGGTARGLEPWQSTTVGDVSITAVPAQHGPDGTEHLVGPVTGFVLEADGQTVYVSGDNASLAIVREIAGRFPRVDVAVLFGGAARTPLVGDHNLTISAAEMVEATRLLGAAAVVPAHVDSWAHFTESIGDVRTAFAAAGLEDRLREPDPAK
ncbi:MBL fold metallo-hydrolase [Actinoplanes sp. CA-131856]